MPTFTPIPSSTYLGAYNPNVSGFISIDLALSPGAVNLEVSRSQNQDITLDPSGNIQSCSGNTKLIQDIMLFLLSPVGSNLVDLTWGNKSLELLNEAISYKGQVEQLIMSSINDLKKFKDNEKNLRGRLLEASELISAILNVQISSGNPTDNILRVLVTIETVLGDIIKVPIPIF